MTHNYWNEKEVQRFFLQYEDFCPPKTEKHWAKVDLVLGDARSNCQGAGICKISARGSYRQQNCDCTCVPAWLGKINDDCLQLVFDKRLLSFSQLKLHFPHQRSVVSQQIELPYDVAEKLDISVHRPLQPNVFKLAQQGNYFHQFLDL